MKIKKIVIASHSKHKIAEINHYFSNQTELSQLQFKPLSEYSDSSIEETGSSFVENALIKARYASNLSGETALADDSGLCLPILNGKPGIFSARFAADDSNFSPQDDENNQYLLKKLEAYPEKSQRQAYYVAVLVWLRYPNDPDPIIVQSRLYGEILKKPVGNYGFGYDPLFYLPSLKCSLAELSLIEKNKLSHRAQALTELKEKLIELAEI